MDTHYLVVAVELSWFLLAKHNTNPDQRVHNTPLADAHAVFPLTVKGGGGRSRNITLIYMMVTYSSRCTVARSFSALHIWSGLFICILAFMVVLHPCLQ